ESEATHSGEKRDCSFVMYSVCRSKGAQSAGKVSASASSEQEAMQMGDIKFDRDGNLISQLLLYVVLLLTVGSLMIAAWQTT
uniref:hypothetical protein n=1 Tax=Bradyrhizobium sp. Ai1a-2 TaxID=196490 RepID=UPI0005BE2237